MLKYEVTQKFYTITSELNEILHPGTYRLDKVRQRKALAFKQSEETII